MTYSRGDMTYSRPDSAWETLAAYARILRRRAWIVVLFVVLVPLVAVYVSSLQDSVYEASAKVLVSQQGLAANLTNVATQPSVSDPVRFMQTQARLARATQVARVAVEAVSSPKTSAAELLRSSSVGAETDSDLLVFSVQSQVPSVAAALANAYARSYARYRNNLETAPLRRALTTISGRLAELRRKGKLDSALGTSLLDKQQQLQTIEALQTDGATLVEPASAAEAVKIKPQLLKVGQLALVFGLFIGVGLAFLLEALDRRLRSAGEIPERLRLPILGRIPPLSRRDDLPAMTQPGGPQADAYRILRMNLEFATAESNVRTVMVTSALEGEGKSTTAANLAITLARAGRNVILVDADFLRPSLAGLFSVAPSPGLVQVARRHADLERALAAISLPGSATRTHSESPPTLLALTNQQIGGQRKADRSSKHAETNGTLRLLATERASLDSTEIMGGGGEPLRQIIAQLEADAELVIIDAPPVGTSVSLFLSSLVDGVLVVANAEMLREQTLDELVFSLDKLPGAKLGLVLTAIDAQAGSTYAYGNPKSARPGGERQSTVASDGGI